VNIQDYIESGMLEAYVLGDLTPAEKAEVESNLLKYPELRKALDEIELTQEQLLLNAAIGPDDSVKRKLFHRIDDSGELRKSVTLPLAKDMTWKYAAAASIAVALVAGGLAFYYWSQYNRVASDLRNLVAQNQQMAQNYNRVNEDLEILSSEVAVLENPRFNRVVMTGTDKAPDAIATVYWNDETDEVFLRIQNMKELSKEYQYQLWAIVDGKPVDAGVFDTAEKKLLRMKDISGGAATFAVTIEARGGKPSPSLETMQVAGNVAKG